MNDLLAEGAERVNRAISLLPMNGRSVLLTGATGLIGANILAALTAAGIPVQTKGRRNGPMLGTYDYIIHAAGYAQPSRFLDDPMGTAAVNTTMLMSLLERLNPGGRLLFLSTSELYNGNPRGLHNENDIGTTTPAHSRAIYIESKRCGEAICHEARRAGKTAIIARVCSVYGPGARKKDTRVMSELIDQGIMFGEIALKDGGQARRVFLYVTDAVEMLLNILIRGEQALYNVGGPAYNTGRGGETVGNMVGEISIVVLARKIGEILKVPVRLPKIASGTDGGAPSHVGLDNGRYVREFGDKHYVDLKQGLPLTVAWHQMLHGDVPVKVAV
jgi:nucleoside-diphosphate-sugar epimerase